MRQDMTMDEVMEYQGRLYFLPKKVIRQKTEELLGFTGLLDYRHRTVRHLSGGMKRKLMICRALMMEPEILLLDEPTKGIDSFFKETFAEILKELKEKGLTIVMVSHDVEFCARYADYVSMFFDGQILTTDTPRRFFGSNSFYTTSANRMSRHVFTQAVTAEDVIELTRVNRA